MKKNIEVLFNTLIQIEKMISQKFRESYEDKSATMLQFSALNFLKEASGSSLGELGTTLNLSKSSTTQLVERIVKSGYVTRRVDTEDRRLTRIFLTHEGEKELFKIRKKIIESMEEIFSNLSEGDIKELVRIHTILLDDLRKRKK